MHFKTKYVSLPFTKNELVSYISAHENIAMQIQIPKGIIAKNGLVSYISAS